MTDRRTRDRVRESLNGDWDHDDHRALRLVVTVIGDEIDGLHEVAREISRTAQECSAEDRETLRELRRHADEQFGQIRRLIIGGLGSVIVLEATLITAMLSR